MSEDGYLYSPKQIADAVKRSETEAAKRPPRKVSEEAGDLEVTREIPTELYYNAVNGHGVDPQDMDYWKSMEKVVPSIKVKQEPGRIFIGSSGRFRSRFSDINW